MTHTPYTPVDLNTVDPDKRYIAVHDGTGTQPAGLYWFQESQNLWVKVSDQPPSNSITIGL